MTVSEILKGGEQSVLLVMIRGAVALVKFCGQKKYFVNCVEMHNGNHRSHFQNCLLSVQNVNLRNHFEN